MWQPDAAIARLVAEEHAATIAYVQTPVGATDFRMSTYFADVGDVSAIEVVNQAQSGYLAAYVKANLPQYAHLPVLSMSSPFKSGSAGVSDYTDVKAGNVALNNAADLYLYPNALYGVKMNGAELKAWLEQSAQRFNTIDPNKAGAAGTGQHGPPELQLRHHHQRRRALPDRRHAAAGPAHQGLHLQGQADGREPGIPHRDK